MDPRAFDFLLGGRQSPMPVAPRAPAQVPLPPKPTPQPPRHSGMFGIRGTARDILGAISDGLLINAGRNPIYHPTRERERRASATYDFQTNPQAAIERLSQIDPEAAQRLAERLQQHRDSIRSNKRDDLALRQDQQEFEIEHQERVRQMAARMYGAAIDEGTFSAMTPRIRTLYERNNLDTSELPTSFADVEPYILSTIDPDDRLDNARADRRTDIAERNAATSERRADFQEEESRNRSRNRDTGTRTRRYQARTQRLNARTNERREDRRGRNTTDTYINNQQPPARVRLPGNVIVGPGQTAVRRNGRWRLVN